MLSALKKLFYKKTVDRNAIISQYLNSDIDSVVKKYDYHINGTLEKLPSDTIYCILPNKTLITYSDGIIRHICSSKQSTLFTKTNIIDVTALSNTLIIITNKDRTCEVYNIISGECVTSWIIRR